MVFSVGNIVYIIVIIYILSPHTYAPHTSQASTSRTQPQLDTPKSCIGWILQLGFGDNPAVNKQFALTQRFVYNHDVSLWAAGYVYGLFHDNCCNLGFYQPWVFCNRQVPPTALFSYVSLKDATFSCEGWINFYGYNHKSLDPFLNLHWATKRETLWDPHISIWATGYFSYITSHETRNQTTSAEFCRGIGHITVDLPNHYPFMKLDDSRMTCQAPDDYRELQSDIRQLENDLARLPFMTMYDTRLTCPDWITLYGYTDSIAHNSNKISYQERNFDRFIAQCTLYYLGHLRMADNPLTPTDFCRVMNKSPPILLNYYCF